VVELVYTLNGEFEREYEAKVKARVQELGLEDKFIFTGPLNDDAKWDAYDRADLFVLPTYSENFGIVVAEALWAGVPVITTKGTPWSELEEYKCGKWIDLPAEGSNPSAWDALDEALVSVMAMSDAERGEMGMRGRKLVEEKYTWDAVVGALVAVYLKCKTQKSIKNVR
jgi:glycosyltransferase involved in cell wall biosynthesis